MVTKVDLHVHSRYSDRPSEWILRRIGAPECYTPPRTVYDVARRRGMQFVTISDHNSIDGAREIAHLPGAFVSNEITTYFPDDGCKVHVLCWDITEREFDDIQRLRENIFDLRDYMCGAGIVHACAHPLYSINDRLTIRHFEQLLVLFNVFETMNGGRNRRGNALVEAILTSLSPETFAEMTDRHGIDPVGMDPWLKGFTGGSDDHSGAFIAKGFTECPESRSITEYLGHVAARRSRAGGFDGTPLSFAHSLYSIGYQYYRDRFLSKSAGGHDLVLRMFGEVFGRDPAARGIRGRVSSFAKRLTGRPEHVAEIEFKRMVSTEMATLFGEDWLRDDFVANAARYEEINRRTFQLSCRIANQLLFQFSKKFVEKLSAGSIFGSIEALSAAGPILLGMAPYLFSFAHQNRDKQFLEGVGSRFLGAESSSEIPRKAWFTDGLADVNGVTTLIEMMCRMAERHGHELTLVSIGDKAPDVPSVKHFEPVGSFTLPENDSVTLSFPPLLDILEYCDQQQFTELVVSTPGLAGLAALIAGKILNIKLVGVYHTDLPQYIRYYTDDESMESAAWRYLRWFYDQMDVVYVPSETYRRQLVARGLAPEKLRLFPHGTDVEKFHPRHRDRVFWRNHGPSTGPVVTYVGRVAKEKDLDVLVDVYGELRRRRADAVLTVVGDGPLLRWMRERLDPIGVVFTGFLFDDDLSRAYASSDVFVFPSTTDTFGNVVLEAMASGVPVVVSDRGGPSEIVRDGDTGIVTRARDAAAIVAAVESLIDDDNRRTEMAARCRAYAEGCGWENIYRDFCNGESGVLRVMGVDSLARQAS